MPIKHQSVEGLVAAPHTPFNSSFELNLSPVEAQYEYFIQQGLAGVFVAGTTGEGSSLTNSEATCLFQRWVEVRKASGSDDLRIIAQVGTENVKESRARAVLAAKAGVDAIGLRPPSFIKPNSIENLIATIAEIVKDVPHIPLYYYHIPSVSGVALAMEEFLQLSAKHLDSLVGVKFTHEDLPELQRCLAVCNGKFDIMFGRDEMLLAGLSLGIQGAVGSTYNFAAPLYQNMIKCFKAGKIKTAQKEQQRSIQMIETLKKYDFLPASKAVMGFISEDLNLGPARLPLRNLSEAEKAALKKDLLSIGFFDWATVEGKERKITRIAA